MATTWTRIIPPHKHGWHSKKTAEKRRSLEKQLESIEKNRCSIDGDREKVELTPLEELLPEVLFDSSVPRATLFECLKQELAFRRGLAEFHELQRKDQRREYDRACKAFEDIQADVRSRLESIGFRSLDRFEQGPGKIEPGMILTHPEVVAARERKENLRHDWDDHAKQNADAIEVITKEMHRLKRQAVAA